MAVSQRGLRSKSRTSVGTAQLLSAQCPEGEEWFKRVVTKAQDFETGLRALHVVTLAPDFPNFGLSIVTGRVPVFRIVGADSLSAAAIVRWAFQVRDALHGEHDAIESTNGADFTGEALPGDSSNGSLGVVATDGPESS